LLNWKEPVFPAKISPVSNIPSEIHPYNGSDEKKPIPPEYAAAPGDNGYNDLTPDDYIKVRICDQIDFYKNKIVRLDLRLRIFQWLIYITGGVGTFLAAVGFELWVALTIALAALFTTFLEYRQIQNTLIQYNQAVTNLVNLQNWWIALPVDDKKKQQNKDKLVDSSSETILNSELTGWVEQMQSAMAKIYEQKPTTA
jgi:conflict system pore-forming effector with SLATT domain